MECVTAHLRGLVEDLGSEVVFWIDEWSIEFGHHFDVAHVHDHSPLSASLRRYRAIFLAPPTLVNWRPS